MRAQNLFLISKYLDLKIKLKKSFSNKKSQCSKKIQKIKFEILGHKKHQVGPPALRNWEIGDRQTFADYIVGPKHGEKATLSPNFLRG